MKKLCYLSLILLLIAALCACGGKEPIEATMNSTPAATSADPSAGATEPTVDTIDPGDDPNNTMGAEVLKFTLLEDKTYAVSAAEDLYACDDIHLRIPSEYKGKAVTTIANSAFQNLYGLVSVSVPDSVTSIGGSAFYGCTYLTSITIPDSVTSIGSSAFSRCSSLTSIFRRQKERSARKEKGAVSCVFDRTGTITKKRENVYHIHYSTKGSIIA